ncbi:MAG: hypothetical protein RSC93_07800 [Erysipelotrichaceae bacterium]
MKKYNSRTNIYSRLETIYDMDKELNLCASYNLIKDATNLNYNTFFQLLNNYEKECGYKFKEKENTKKYKNRLAISLDVLLPFELSYEHYESFSNSLIKYLFKNQPVLPYCSFIKKEGNGTYLHLLISERMYHPEEICVNKYATRNIYRNEVTGRLCKPDNVNASLAIKKGDILKTKKTHFSNKVSTFYFSNGTGKSNDFSLFKENLDFFLEAKFRSYEVVFQDCFITPKIDKRQFKSSIYSSIDLYNHFIQSVESMMEMMSLSLSTTDDVDTNVLFQYQSLCQYLSKFFKQNIYNFLTNSSKFPTYKKAKKHIAALSIQFNHRFEEAYIDMFEGFLSGDLISNESFLTEI